MLITQQESVSDPSWVVMEEFLDQPNHFLHGVFKKPPPMGCSLCAKVGGKTDLSGRSQD